MYLSIFYSVIATIFLILAFLWKRTENKLNVIENIAIIILTFMCWNAFAVGIIQIINIKISLISVAISYFIPILYFSYKIKLLGIQKSEISLWDILPILMGGILLGHYVKSYFGLDLNIHFISSDAARHMNFALTIVDTGKTALNMYFHSINDALVMMCFDPFISIVGQAKVYVLMEILDICLPGLLFYAIIRPMMHTMVEYIVGNILLFLYVCGYPLYAVQFGFSYFSAAIIIIEFIILITRKYVENNTVDWLILLNLSLFSLFVCYTYFVPITFVSVFLVIVLEQIKKGKLFVVGNAIEHLKVFIIPSILGMYYSIENISELSTTSGSGGIINEGGCYTDLFSNFILFLPVALVGLTAMKRNKKNNTISVFAILNIIFTIVTFLLCMKGKMSAYYYYKEYNVLWLLMFLCFFYGILELKAQRMDIVIISVLLPVCMVGMVLFHIEDKITARNDRIMNVSATSFANIYTFNYNFYKESAILHPLNMDLILYVDDLGTDEAIAIGDEVTCAWFQTLTNSKYSFSYGTPEDLKAYIDEVHPRYLCVFASELYEVNKEYLDSLGECIYQNGNGIVIKVK